MSYYFDFSDDEEDDPVQQLPPEFLQSDYSEYDEDDDDDDDDEEDSGKQGILAGPLESAMENLAVDAATKTIMSEMHIMHALEPAVRLCARSLPESSDKTLLLQVFDQWDQLFKLNSVESPPNMLHLAYISLIMSRCIILVLEKIVQQELNSSATMAVNMLAAKLKSAVY